VIPTVVEQLKSLASSAPAALEDLRSRYVDLVGGQADGGASQIKGLVNRFLDRPLSIIEPLLSVGAGVVGVIFTVVLIILTAYYIAVRPEPLLDGAVRLFPPGRREWVVHVMARLRTAWVGWMRGVIADMLISGTLLYIGLTLVGLDYALLFSVFSALLVVIPYFGSVVAGLPPVLLALTDSPQRALVVLLVYIAVQQIESNLVIPLIMSQTVRLHPAMIAVGVVAVGALFGVVGLFVAVPVLSTIQIFVDELWVRPAERAHERRPVLSPPAAATADDGPTPEPTIFQRPPEPAPGAPEEGSASA
jgi:predicted PurR-regulated permease PerM